MDLDVKLKTSVDVARIRRACRVAEGCLRSLKESVRPGVTTMELNRLAEAFLQRQGAVPALRGYRGFPCAFFPKRIQRVGAPSCGLRSITRACGTLSQVGPQPVQPSAMVDVEDRCGSAIGGSLHVSLRRHARHRVTPARPRGRAA